MLKSEEFLAALSTTPRRQFNQLTKEHVLEMCSNMVVFDSRLDTFRFAHLSVREFLEKRPEYTIQKANALAAETCLFDVLSGADNQVSRRFLSSYGQDPSNSTLPHDLRQYSTIYWAPHCQLSAHQRTVGVLKDLLCHFISNDSNQRLAVVVWASRIKERLNDYSIDWNLTQKLGDIEAHHSQRLFIACCFDLQEFVREETDFTKYPVNIRGQTALHVAVNHGSCKVISILIKNKLIAIEEEVVKAAAGNWQSGKEVMALLLEQRGADVVITEKVVKAAATSGQEGVLQTIEDHFKISLSKQEWSIAQFYNAAKAGNEDTIQKLMGEGAEPDLKNPRHVFPLWVAATNGHLKVVQILLGTNLVDVNSKGISRRSPIFWAAARGRNGIVRLLLEAGADYTFEDINGDTPLSMAKKNGHDKIAKMMFSR